MKICSKCFTEKDLNFFQKRKDSKDGYRSSLYHNHPFNYVKQDIVFIK